MIPKEHRNPQKDLPYTEGALDTFKKYGYLMFPQQKKIYQGIAHELAGCGLIVEAGCGIGLGTAILQRISQCEVIGTDKLKENVDIARELYPWLTFWQWDIRTPAQKALKKPYAVVCIETIEHVDYPRDSLDRMIDLAEKEVWISTPDGNGKSKPPSNPYHVYEFTPQELVQMVMGHADVVSVEILNYNTMLPITVANGMKTWDQIFIDPLVYKVVKK